MSWDFPPGRRVSRLTVPPQIGNTNSEVIFQQHRTRLGSMDILGHPHECGGVRALCGCADIQLPRRFGGEPVCELGKYILETILFIW